MLRSARNRDPRVALRTRARARAAIVITMLAAVMVTACRGERAPPPHDGPIVLITIDALRADVVGALGGDPALTPNLDRLAAESAWAAPAVAASSWTVPSMASIMTGMQPWRHGNWHSGRTRLRDSVTTLAEALSGAGYRTTAFRSNTWLSDRFGYQQGFDEFFALARGKRAEARLAALDGGRELIWIHVLPPHAPYVFREELEDQVADAPAALPKRVRPADLEPYFDPAVELEADRHAVFWALYRFNVAWADRIAGRLLDSVRASGHWDDALIVVTSDHGEEFGENGQITHGGNLHRVLLEVPLFIKLPAGGDWQLDSRPWVANHRIYSTILEMVGVEAPEHALPSLWPRSHRSTENGANEWAQKGALAELYEGDGVNTFSLVTEGRQLILTSRFAPAEPDYYAARLASVKGAQKTVSEDLAAVFERVSRAFLEAEPVSGSGLEPPRLQLETWALPSGSTSQALAGSRAAGESGPAEVALARPETLALARRLTQVWEHWNGPQEAPAELAVEGRTELTEAERQQLRALGYVVD